MRLSRLFAPTLKDAPKEAELPSHQLLLRAGYIRQLAAGIYDFLPLGRRTLRRVEAIVREEMDRAGAQEVLLPGVQPAELWQESGRWSAYGPELLRFKDRKGAEFALGPTHEEVITALVRHELRSYRQLPVNLYQVQTKFRDEIRPRAGLLRGREFIMKDAYSFDVDADGAERSYESMRAAYEAIFTRCGLDFRRVEADTGAIGGSLSHEFHVLVDTGEDAIVACSECTYAANVEMASIRAPDGAGGGASTDVAAPRAVDTPGTHSVEAVADLLGVAASSVLKTLVFQTDQGPVAAVLPGDREAHPTKVKLAVGAQRCELAGAAVVKEVTGAPVGFAGPIGIDCPVLVDHHVILGRGYVAGANEADTHLRDVVVGRDVDGDEQVDLTVAVDGDGCGVCGGSLRTFRGIEVGHIFYLGTKYSESMHATVLDDTGTERLMEMGCYGIGVSRIMAAAVEQHHDGDGIIWPIGLAPYPAVVLALGNDAEVLAAAASLCDDLASHGVEVLFDDRKERPGVKFKEADLMGLPYQVVIGRRGLANGVVELKNRATGERSEVPLDAISAELRGRIAEALAASARIPAEGRP